jgi:hypothetical protein
MKLAGLTTFLFLIILIDFQGKAQNLFDGWEHLFQPKKTMWFTKLLKPF